MINALPVIKQLVEMPKTPMRGSSVCVLGYEMFKNVTLYAEKQREQ